MMIKAHICYIILLLGSLKEGLFEFLDYNESSLVLILAVELESL